MRKFVCSIIILILVLFSGMVCTGYLHRSSGNTSKMIDDTIDYTRKGMWPESSKSIGAIESGWNKTEGTWAMLVDHSEIDNIEMAMTKAKYYIETRNAPLSLAELYNLKFMVEHIYEMEVINLKNIF